MRVPSNRGVDCSRVFWIEAHDVVGLDRFMEARGWLEAGERLRSCEPAGDGNMNVTLRVVTDRRSVIVKQARPWVEKYPDIPAPWDRLLVEAGFYRTIRDIPAVAERMPHMLAVDAEARVIVLEDFAAATDMTALYRGATIRETQCTKLGAYLAALHAAPLGEPRELFANRAMRALNHAHLYDVPFTQPDGERLAALEPGLDLAARRLAADAEYRARVAQIAACYLDDGPCLVHGDFFPGSWLVQDPYIWIIDAEFCFGGDAEFDLGTAIAHLALSKQKPSTAGVLLAEYRRGRKGNAWDEGRVARYAAAEVMRRIIGVAQLPIPHSQGWRRRLLDRSRVAMMAESWEALWS